MLHEKQLIWRCRRGVRELDVLFGRFLNTRYCELDDEQKDAFERLLEVQDPVIMDWLLGRSQTEDGGVAEMVSILRDLSGLKI